MFRGPPLAWILYGEDASAIETVAIYIGSKLNKCALDRNYVLLRHENVL